LRPMTAFIDPQQHAPDLYRSLLNLDKNNSRSGLDPKIAELVRIRVSQLNNCAYCIDMHSKDALAADEPIERVLGVTAWRETAFYSPAEQAALAFAEALTLPPDHARIEAARDAVRNELGEEGVAQVVFTIATTKAWNALGVGLQYEVGTYQAAAA
jgi:AhpD family alkylhydroperoxidase